MSESIALNGFPLAPQTGNPVLLGVVVGVTMAACITSVVMAPSALYTAPAVAVRPAVHSAIRPLGQPLYQGGMEEVAEPYPMADHSTAAQTTAPLSPMQSAPAVAFWGPLVAAVMGVVWIVRSLMPTNSNSIAMAPWTARHRGRDSTETGKDAAMRRMEESAVVEDRMEYFTSMAELKAALKAATKPDQLFVVEVEPESDDQCDVMVEDAWGSLKKSAEENPCVRLRHSFARTARNCKDVHFMAIVNDGSPEVKEVCQKLEVTQTPAVVFIKGARVVWKHEGIEAANEDLAEGVAYYGDDFADGSHISSLVPDIHSADEVMRFAAGNPSEVLRVVTVLTTTASTCVHLFPAITSVARKVKGKASFARLLGDESATANKALKDLGVTYVPTMLVYDAKTGKEVARYVVNSRSDWMVKFLDEMDKAKESLY